ncbi:hypothetical protein BJV74DRAFT_886651 [Russula compacta]|nr:hypothetical protein BJV74DRAFT_886651 [Russula compacta]
MSPSNNDSLPSDEQGSTYNSEELESDNSVHLMPSTQISPDMSKAELLKKTSHTAKHAITAEVYASITPKLQAALKNELHRQSFIDIFLYHLKQERSNIMHMELEQLLQNPMKPAEKYPLFPSLLYPSKDCTSPLLLK